MLWLSSTHWALRLALAAGWLMLAQEFGPEQQVLYCAVLYCAVLCCSDCATWTAGPQLAGLRLKSNVPRGDAGLNSGVA